MWFIKILKDYFVFINLMAMFHMAEGLVISVTNIFYR